MESASWIGDGPWLAWNIKNASSSSSSSLEINKNCDASINCPSCSYLIKNSNVQTPTWPGLPKGVKFEPTDEEVIEHLEAKCGIDGLNPHLLIQDFICSLNEDRGINYTHPQNLPGVKKDGISVFFFNKAQAYGKGQRKRRKITPTGLKDESVCESVHWRKTGKTKPVMINGVQKGCKRILVLSKNTTEGSKPEKYNWVLHQYNLGTEERGIGDFVVSKITYQKQKQGGKTNMALDSSVQEEGLKGTQARPEIIVGEDEIAYDETKMFHDSFLQELEDIPETYTGSTTQVAESFNEDSFLHENFDIGTGNFSVSDMEIPNLGTLPDFFFVCL